MMGQTLVETTLPPAEMPLTASASGWIPPAGLMSCSNVPSTLPLTSNFTAPISMISAAMGWSPVVSKSNAMNIVFLPAPRGHKT